MSANSPFSKDFKLGILGGGQLGRMFIMESIKYDIYVQVLDPDQNAPCRSYANKFVQGSLNDFDAVYSFGKQVDVLTIEIEHVNVDALQKLKEEGVMVFPEPEVLRIIQDKGLQKQFYRNNNIPTSEFYLIESASEIPEYADKFPFFQKLRKGGYDGKGVVKLKDPNRLDNAFNAPSVLEKLVDIEKEISVIVARNEQGEINTYPVVELEYNPEANLVDFLISPAQISSEHDRAARDIATLVADKLKITGLLAVEMFIDKTGKILVNEIAPRTHNSGHHSIEGNITSQFEQHLRSVVNFPLGSTKITSPAVMLNLLGEPGYIGEVFYDGIDQVLKMENVFIHLYGKKETKPYRKMGHVTVLGQTIDEAKSKAVTIKEVLKVKTK